MKLHLRLQATVAVLLVFAFLGGYHIFSPALFRPASVDLGWHWALIDYIREQGHAPYTYSPMLRVMSDYPPLTHAIGALVSYFTGSSLIAMHLLSLLAVALVYTVIASELSVLGSVIFALAALELGRRRLLIGHEVIENYFYAQLIATGLAISLLAIVLRIKDRRWQAAAAIGATLLLNPAYPTTALLFAGSVGFVWLCSFVRLVRERTVPPKIEFVWLGLFALALILSVLSSSYFWGMIGNAAHNGTMQTWLSFKQVGMLGLAVTAVALWFGSGPVGRSPLIVGAAGSFGLLAGAQWVALLLSFGSPYAVLKLQFGVGAFGAALAALILTSYELPRSASSGWRVLMAVPILAAVFYANTRITHARDLAGLRSYEAAVRQAAAQMPELKNTTISANSKFDGALNWSVSLVALAAEYGVGVDQLGAYGFVLQPDARSPGARFAALPADQAGTLPAGCLVATVERISIIKFGCVPATQIQISS
jgi:hypothetical protein